MTIEAKRSATWLAIIGIATAPIVLASGRLWAIVALSVTLGVFAALAVVEWRRARH